MQHRSKEVDRALKEPPGQGYDCPICGEYQASDELRYHPKIHDPKFAYLQLASLEKLFGFYLDRTAN